MCIICVEFQKDRLSIVDARRNLRELVEDDPEHAREVEALLEEAEKKDVD